MRCVDLLSNICKHRTLDTIMHNSIMKKKILIMATCVALAFSFTGCGKDKDNTASSGEVTDNSKADLKGTKYKSEAKVGEYKGIKVGESTNKAEEKEIQTAIDNILSNYAKSEEVADGVAQDGDTLNIDYVGKVNGVAFDGGTAQGTNLTLGSGTFIDGFESGLVGKKKGDVVELNLTFPNPYQNNPDLAGKAVVFTVTVNSISRTTTPELTDAFVKENCSSYKTETVEELKDYVEKEIIFNKKMNVIWPQVLENSTIEYNDDELNKYIKIRKDQMSSYFKQNGSTLEGYLEYASMSQEDYDAQIKEYVQSVVKNQVIAMQIARTESIAVTDEEYDEEAQAAIKNGGYDSIEAYQADYPKQDTVDSLLYYDVLHWIAEQAKVVPDSEIETTTQATSEATDETTQAETTQAE